MRYSARLSVVHFEVVEFAMSPMKKNKAQYVAIKRGKR
jgi:hypothetical protein